MGIEKPITYNSLTLNDQSQRGVFNRIKTGAIRFIQNDDPAVYGDAGTAWISTDHLDELDNLYLYCETIEKVFKIQSFYNDDTLILEGNVEGLSAPYLMDQHIPYVIVQLGNYYKVKSLTGLDDAEVRDERIVRPGGNGEIVGRSLYGGRPIVIAGEFVGFNWAHLRHMEDTLKKAFGDLEDHDLVYQTRGFNQRQVSARKNQKLDIPEEQNDPRLIRTFTVSLRAANSDIFAVAQGSMYLSGVSTSSLYRTYDMPSYPGGDLTNLKSYLKFENNLTDQVSGSATIVDLGTSPIGSTPDYVTGHNGTGMLFSSLGQFQVKKAVGSGVSCNQLSMGAWFNFNSFQAGFTSGLNAALLGLYLNAGSTPIFQLFYYGGRFYFRKGVSVGIEAVASGGEAFVWIHVGVRRHWVSGNTYNMELYINGQMVDMFTTTDATVYTYDYLSIGHSASAVNDTLDSIIDEPYLYTGNSAAGVLPFPNTLRAYSRTYVTQPNTTTSFATTKGTYPTYPLSQIHGPIENPILRNSSTGEELIFTDKIIPEGSYVEIDHEAGTIKDNGLTLNYTGFDLVNSDFWQIYPDPTVSNGDNDIRLTAFSSGESAYLTMTWRDAFR